MGHLPKCQLLIACLPRKTDAPTSHLRAAPSSMYLQRRMRKPFPLSLLRMWCLPSKINTNEIISASPEIPREGTQQNPWKILEGYKLHIKVLELWERWKNSRCKTRRGGRLCIKTIKIYNCFNGQLFFAFVHGFEFAWGCQMPWKGVLFRMDGGGGSSLSVLPLFCFVNATFPLPHPWNVLRQRCSYSFGGWIVPRVIYGRKYSLTQFWGYRCGFSSRFTVLQDSPRGNSRSMSWTIN